MRQKTNLHTPALIDRTTVKVRFSEIDSMQIVWHGEYVRYFEDIWISTVKDIWYPSLN